MIRGTARAATPAILPAGAGMKTTIIGSTILGILTLILLATSADATRARATPTVSLID